ncbi:MAG: hypothetical protein WC307_05235 [Candidatus Nanoarchaeia archaeon]
MNGPWIEVMVKTAATVDDGDTIVMILPDCGIKTLESIQGWAHSTSNSVVITEAPTTSVTTGTLTITVGGSTDNMIRIYKVVGLA